jgi:5-hydroxyisourate hydrolase-like protein (transthyretin family)
MYPNPTTNSFKIEFELEKQSEVSIELYSIDGKKIRQIENKTIDSGKYSNIINMENLSAGSYMLTFKIDNSKFSKVIIKQ